MAHNRLFPKEGEQFLSPNEVLDRLKREFANVDADKGKGEEYVLKMVAQLARMQDLTPPPAPPEVVERLRISKSEATFVAIRGESNDDDSYLTTCIIPWEPLVFAYSSAQHEKSARPLLERIAKILNYHIEEH